MLNFTPRLLKALFVGVVLSLLTTVLAIGGLVDGLVDTVEDLAVYEEAEESVAVEEETVTLEEENSLQDIGDPVQDESGTVQIADNVSVEVDEDLLTLDGEDKYLTVENELLESWADYLGLGALGEFAYDIQEYTLHGNITKITGKKVDHYYVWVCFGDACLPVDPFTASN